MDPQIFRIIVDKYITNYQDYETQEFIYWVWILLAWMAWVALVSRIAKNFQDYYVNVMTQKIWMETYQEAISHAFWLPYRVFEDTQSWQLLQKLQKARQDIQSFISLMINVAFVSSVTLLFVIWYAFFVNRIIALLFLSLIPIMWITMYIMSKKIREAQKTIVSETSLLAGATTETIRNVSLIKSLGLEWQEMARLETANKKILALELKKIKFLRSLEFIQGTLINTMRIIIIWVMFWLVFQESISLWEYFSLFFYSFFVFAPLREAWSVIKTYQEAKASDDVLREFLAQDPAILPENPQSIHTVKTIDFKNVSFGYTAEQNVLHSINRQAKSWETIAFVGPSWSWKSTLLKLLVWLYTTHSGDIKINNTLVQDLDPSMYKQLLGIVAQDTQLFSGTIRENLLFVNPEATEKECIAVLKQAQILDIIQKNDTWLDTRIGEWGLKLSGWQRQRLAIARALLRHPSVIIFDEATSSLDSLVEAEITATIQAISQSNPNIITLLVAHRLSTVMHADRIFVLEQWKIVEIWTHTQLVAEQWLYAALWRQQSGWDKTRK